jgi:hypothetical protein
MPSGRANHTQVTGFRQRVATASALELATAKAADALAELHNLLEENAPLWYTRRHHARAESALREGPTAVGQVLIELYHLLERYAPRWYKKEHHKRAESALRQLKSLEKATSKGRPTRTVPYHR